MSHTPPKQSESIAIVVDRSSSANSYWDETQQTARQIYFTVGTDQSKLFVLGNSEQISREKLDQPNPTGFNQQTGSSSLIAPVMEALIREERKHLVIVVGNGEIFDLDDWVDAPHVEGWLFVQTGPDSLQGESKRFTEINPDQIDDKKTLFSYFSRFPGESYEPDHHRSSQGGYEWKVDASGYPLILVKPLESFVHLFPVTKPQFEKFIASGREQRFNDDWYSKRLAMSPRASYRSPDIPVREQLFMTGISTDEATAFGRWLGREYKLLSTTEWCACYSWFAEQPVISPPPDLYADLSRDARAVWGIIEEQCLEQRLEQRQKTTLQELSLMKKGIFEWVIDRSGTYCGLGEPTYSLNKACDPIDPMYLIGAEPRRVKNLGFRLSTR